MLSFLRNNLAWMLLSVMLSTGLWLMVTVSQNPDIPVPFASVPVQVKCIPDGLAPVTTLQPARVTLKAPQDVVPELRVDKIRVEVDASRVGEGTHELPVKVSVLDSRARFESVEPATIYLTLEPHQRKEVPVRVNQIGSVAFGFVARPERVNPSIVTVSGPQSLVGQVSAVVVDVPLDGHRSTVNQRYRPVAVSRTGAAIDRVTVEPEGVLVEVPIEQQVSVKTLPVVAELGPGRVAHGYQILGIQTEPQTVTVVGDPRVLAGLEYVQTRPVDVAGAKGDVATQAEPNLPTGASLAVSQRILVRVLVRPVESSKLMEVAPATVGLPSNLTAQIDPGSLRVTVSGPLPVLTQLRPEDIVITVDVTGLGPGTHTVRPQVRRPDLVRVESVEPMELLVTIR